MAEERLESIVGELVRSQELTLSVAESCTGGLLGHRLTNAPGSSDYFIGGVVAYSYEAKLFGTDLALSVTGIAGPGGGMPDKPVGLVYIAISTWDQDVCHQFLWEGDREENKADSAQAALELLVDCLREGAGDR
jgi:nicotinamide-nucleotide amidase